MNDYKEELMHAADLLTKAASYLEYNNNLQKEAAATTDAMITKGLLRGDQRETYTNFLTQNPEKIASMNNVLSDISAGSADALGEVAGNINSSSYDDAFDRAILGF